MNLHPLAKSVPTTVLSAIGAVDRGANLVSVLNESLAESRGIDNVGCSPFSPILAALSSIGMLRTSVLRKM